MEQKEQKNKKQNQLDNLTIVFIVLGALILIPILLCTIILLSPSATLIYLFYSIHICVKNKNDNKTKIKIRQDTHPAHLKYLYHLKKLEKGEITPFSKDPNFNTTTIKTT